MRSTGRFFILFLTAQLCAAGAFAEDGITVSPDMSEVKVPFNPWPLSVRDVSFQKQGELQIRFNDELRELDSDSGEVPNYTQCDTMIDIPSGHGNHSYGAFCVSRERNVMQRVAVCKDELFGDFAFDELRNRVWTKADLIKYVVRHCVGS